MIHDIERVKRLYAASPFAKRLNNIADAGYAIQGACNQLAAIPTVDAANTLNRQLRTLSHSVGQLRRVLIDGGDKKEGQGTNLASHQIDTSDERLKKNEEKCSEKL